MQKSKATPANDSYLRALGPQFLSAVDKHVFPVFIEHESGLIELVGSGVAVVCNGRKLLVTAQHVIESVFRSGLPMLIADNRTGESGNMHRLPLPLTSNWVFHPESRLDLAAAIADDAFPRLEHFSLDAMVLPPGEVPCRIFLAGYPISVNKERKVNLTTTEKRSGIASIIIRLEDEQALAQDRKNPDDFLGFRYKGVWHDGQHKTQGISLRGLSGSGLWAFPNDNPRNPYLAGIFIEHFARSSMGYATMVKHVRSLKFG